MSGYPILRTMNTTSGNSSSDYEDSLLSTDPGIFFDASTSFLMTSFPMVSSTMGVILFKPGLGDSRLPPGARFNSAGYLDNLAVAVPMGVSLYALSLLTFVGNAMVLHAIRTERRLQTVSNMFIMSLAVADLTVGMIVMPVSSAYAITGDWRLGLVLCQFWLAADYTASTASILNLLILSLDRYWSIRHPLKYIRKRTKRRALVMIAIVWLISTMWIVPIIAWHHWYNGGIRKQPDNVCETEFADNVLFKLTTSTANFYVPMVLMMALYAKIFYEIKKRSKLEIGQCNVGMLSGSAYDVSVRGDGKLGLSRNSSKTLLTKRSGDNQGSTRRQCVCTEYKSSLQHKPLSRQSSSEDRRFDRLTLLTMKPKGVRSVAAGASSGSSSGSGSLEKMEEKMMGNSQFFHGVTVNIEYVDDDASEPNSEEAPVVAGSGSGGSGASCGSKANSFQDRKACCGRSSTATGTTRGSTKLVSMCPCLSIRKRRASEEDFECVEKPSRQMKCTLQLADFEPSVSANNSCRRAGSTSNRLNNNLAALRMRVTRKNFASNLRQEKKAARQLGVIMGAFILCWLPYIIIFIVTACCDDCVSSPVHTASIWLGYLNSAMNPFLYALCNRNFKRAFKNMFRGRSKSRHFLAPSNNTNRTEHLFA